VAAYRAALEELRHDRVPLAWAQTLHNLAEAETALGDKTSDTSRWRSAIASCEAALEEFRRADATHYVEKATGLRDRLILRLVPGCPPIAWRPTA